MEHNLNMSPDNMMGLILIIWMTSETFIQVYIHDCMCNLSIHLNCVLEIKNVLIQILSINYKID